MFRFYDKSLMVSEGGKIIKRVYIVNKVGFTNKNGRDLGGFPG